MAAKTSASSPDRKAEASLAASGLDDPGELYRALVETTGTGYVVLDAEGRVQDANREYVRLTGHFALEEILGRTVVEWTIRTSSAAVWRKWPS